MMGDFVGVRGAEMFLRVDVNRPTLRGIRSPAFAVGWFRTTADAIATLPTTDSARI